MRTPLLVCALALLAPVGAQTANEQAVIPSKNIIHTFVFKEKQNGKTGIRGRIKRIVGKKVTFSVYDGPATWDEHHDLDVFTPASQFRIMQVVTPDTVEAQLNLARWGLDHDAPVQARYALATARGLAKDPSLAKGLEKSIRERNAVGLQTRFRYDLAKGKVRTAEQTLRELNRYYADVVAANVRQQMKTSLQAREAEFRQQRREKAAQEAVARKDKQFDSRMKPLRMYVQRGQADIQRGLNAGSSMSKALGSFRRATSNLERAVRGCDHLKKTYGNQQRYAGHITYLQEQANRSLNDSLLNSASILTSRGSFNEALGNCNKILARDPNNTRALAMRGRIETAANEGWGWGWGGGRRVAR